jgi:acyl carrier protein
MGPRKSLRPQPPADNGRQAGQMSDARIYAMFSEILGDILGRPIPTLSASVTANDIDGWDSFITVNLIVEIERRFRFKMAVGDFRVLTCVGDFVAVIARAAGGADTQSRRATRSRSAESAAAKLE